MAWTVFKVRAQAPAVTAAFVDGLRTRFPYAVYSIQANGGLEFMAGFEQRCQAR